VALGLEEPEEETALLLTRPQTLFMPVARHPVQFIEFVATVIKPNRFHRGDLICKLQLVGFQLVVELPSSEKIFQESTIRNFDPGASGKLLLVWTLGFSHSITQYRSRPS
jgi:hypothetical protein